MPWGWDDGDDGPVYPPDFFWPAYLVDYYFNGLGEFSRTYVGSSFTEDHEFVVETYQPHQGKTERWGGWRWDVEIEESREVDIYFDRLNIDNNGYLKLKYENGNEIITLSRYQYSYEGMKMHVPANHVRIEMDNLNNGDWGFSIRIKGNSTPYFKVKDIVTDEGSDVYLTDFVRAEDPEGEVTYKLELDPNPNQDRHLLYI